MTGPRPFRSGSRVGKYKLLRRLAQGGFASVYRAHDTMEGVDVALKLPELNGNADEMLADFRREARVAARLDHPNILSLKNADIIDGAFVLAYPLGAGSLADRMKRRIALRVALDLSEQLLAALCHAHERRVIHCDVKPDNVILFDGDQLRLGDFGLAKIAAKTIAASASGTIGYMAPEQALGRPSARSDVFSAGLLIYRLLAGHLPEWPFDWPPARHERIGRRGAEVLEVLRRAMMLDTRKRYRDAGQMLAAFKPAKRKWLSRATPTTAPSSRRAPSDWRSVRVGQFRRRFGKSLDLRHQCQSCHQPVDERMRVCPWCAADPLVAQGQTRLPATCPRCERGVKLDWKYCAWCYGAAIGPQSTRRYTDQRYAARCTGCRGQLLPFSRYCPWCRVRVKRPWTVGRSSGTCTRCKNVSLPRFWACCPWCGTATEDP